MSLQRKRNATAKNRHGTYTLSKEANSLLADLLVTMAKFEQKIELKRQYLATNENFEPYGAFQRLDRNETGFLSSKSFLNFIRDNGLAANVTEADCYYLVKFFDSDLDGQLHYPDFMQIILPCANSRLRAQATQRPNMMCGRYDYLTLDVEKELAELILMEIQMHRDTEDLKQELEATKGYSKDAAYGAVDDCSLNYIYQKNLERFFNAERRKTSDQEHYAIIRRIDLDADQKISREEFLEAIAPQEPYSKMLVRSRAQKRGPRKPVQLTPPKKKVK